MIDDDVFENCLAILIKKGHSRKSKTITFGDVYDALEGYELDDRDIADLDTRITEEGLILRDEGIRADQAAVEEYESDSDAEVKTAEFFERDI